MTPEQMREEAAKLAETCDYPRAAPTEAEAACYDAMAERITDAIRAIPIPPAPDREGLAIIAADAYCRALDIEPDSSGQILGVPTARAYFLPQMRAVLAALEAAGALR